jgi:hypothetical protein
MQIGYLSITIGFQFFLLVGYLLYILFRRYPSPDDSSSLMSYVVGLLSILTFGFVGLLVIVATAIPFTDRLVILLFVVIDLLGMLIIINDLLKRREYIVLKDLENES